MKNRIIDVGVNVVVFIAFLFIMRAFGMIEFVSPASAREPQHWDATNSFVLTNDIIRPYVVEVEWLESPVTLQCRVVKTNAEGKVTESECESVLHHTTDPWVQIGLREGGIVVWRKRQ